jgi:hypothetical protein
MHLVDDDVEGAAHLGPGIDAVRARKVSPKKGEASRLPLEPGVRRRWLHRGGHGPGRGGSRLVRWRGPQAELLQARVHGVPRDPEPGGGERDIPLRHLERGQEVLTHRLVPAPGSPGWRPGTGRHGTLGLQRAQGRRRHHRRIAEQGGALDDIRQLADIAGPGVREQTGLGRCVEPQGGQAILGTGARQEVLGEQQDVAATGAQRRQVDGEHGQPVVEVGPEAPGGDGGAEVDVRGADQPDIGGLGTRAAQGADGPFLDGGEELGLRGVGEQGHLVEEEHAAVGGLEEAALGAAGIGERTLLEAEQLGLLAFGGMVVPVPAQPVQPEPADCGGSYLPSPVNASGEVVEPGWTTFGVCDTVEKTIQGKKVSVPTYPSHPASQVVFEQDKSGKWNTRLQTTDKKGKMVLTLIPDRQAK